MKVFLVLIFSLLALFITPLFSQSDFSQKVDELSQTSQWKRLLHFKNNKSEIDDEQFFFTKNGKTDAHAELKASIEKLMADKSDDVNSTLCRYPARSHWILEQFSSLKKKYLPLSVHA